jgi:hypothetical protein
MHLSAYIRGHGLKRETSVSESDGPHGVEQRQRAAEPARAIVRRPRPNSDALGLLSRHDEAVWSFADEVMSRDMAGL